MSAAGGFLSGGLSGGFGAIGAQLSAATAAGAGAASAAAAIGAVAVPLLAVAAVFSFFKKKVTNLDSGIRLATDGLDSMIETYKVLETSRFWGLSKRSAPLWKQLRQMWRIHCKRPLRKCRRV